MEYNGKKEKIELLEDIINSSTVAKKIIPPSDLKQLLTKKNNLSPILNTEKINKLHESFQPIFDIETLSFDNFLFSFQTI